MTSLFTDPMVEPTARAIADALADAGVDPTMGEQVVGLLADAGVTVVWRYYRDGGWFGKATKGAKTIAWLAVETEGVGVGVHFAERLRDRLLAADTLSQHLRDQIAATEPISGGRLVSTQLTVRTAADLADLRGLVALKLAAR